MRAVPLVTTPIPALLSPVTYNVASGAWQADASVRASPSPDMTFYSAILGQTVSISVMVPDDYATSGIDYPTVWNFAGLAAYPTGQGNRYAASWMPAVYGTAVRAGIVRPHIHAFANPCNYSMWIDDCRGALLMEQHFFKEVMPFVRANFRTLTAARYNVAAGFSMGSAYALYCAFKRPDLFGGAHAYAGPLYDQNADFLNLNDVDGWGPYVLSPTEAYTAVERARWLECRPQGWLTRNAIKPKVRINYGANDGLTDYLNEAFKTLLTANGIAFTAGTPIPGVSHSASGCWQSSDGQLAMAFIESVYAGS